MIDVALTRAELRPASLSVVIDVLRATSTATQALAAGFRSVVCADSLEQALRLRGPRRVLAGERRCVMPLGFDRGNSPREMVDGDGAELVLATTNGAPAIVAAAAVADTVLLGCLLNLDALVAAIGSAEDVQIVCSGTDGRVALENVYTAGRCSARLCGDRTDAALVAEAVARGFSSSFEALCASADARVLLAAGLGQDISYCSLESVLDTVPRVSVAGCGMASIVTCDSVTV